MKKMIEIRKKIHVRLDIHEFSLFLFPFVFVAYGFFFRRIEAAAVAVEAEWEKWL